MALIKKWCLRAESNHRHGDFQSPALPTELQRRFYSACLVYYILSEMSTTFFKIFCIFCKQAKTVTEAQPATVSLSSSVYGGFVPTTSPPLYPFHAGAATRCSPKQFKRNAPPLYMPGHLYCLPPALPFEMSDSVLCKPYYRLAG